MNVSMRTNYRESAMSTSKLIMAVLLFFTLHPGSAQQDQWPVLKTYDQEHTQRIAMPIGGIGTGTVSLNGRGGLQDWEIMNRPAKGFNPWFSNTKVRRYPFFAMYMEGEDQNGEGVLLEGPISPEEYEGELGAIAGNHGLPRFQSAGFQTAYPFGQAILKDDTRPVEVTVGAFNPLIPGNVDDSSIPAAIISYKVKNTSEKPLAIAIAGSIQNFIGANGYEGKPVKNRIIYRDEDGIKGIHYTSEGVSRDASQWGTISVVALSPGETSYRTHWATHSWSYETKDFWEDFTEDGLLEDRPDLGEDAPIGSIATKTRLAAGEEKELRFLITWHFPNRTTWPRPGFHQHIPGTVGNYYATQYEDSWEVAVNTAPRIQELESATKTFVLAFISSDLPTVVKEAALFNLAHLRTQLAFRIKTGQMLGWEGIFSNRGAGFGTCNHVWNYEQVTPFLFGELAQSMREVEFQYATDDNGLMSFRAYLPLEEAQKWGVAAADGQMGAIMKFYREWQLSGDDNFLRAYWPKVKKALEFCWIPAGWDADKDGIMEGSQHNTMDVEYFGPNPQMGFWYLGALRASEEMARYLGERSFAETCRRLYRKGAKWMDENLFNGEYYEQQISPPMTKENVAKGLIKDGKVIDYTSPDFQLGSGVLVDQLIGQVMAHILDLGYLADKGNSAKAHQAIAKYNYRENLSRHVNFMRSYVLGDEPALLMAAYPKNMPERPFPYYSEVMTGFEYTAAVGMLYDGQEDMALRTIQDVRNRYDGKKRNPFNEAEFGHHYARSMVAWGAVLAISGFHYSAVEQRMKLNPENGTHFWSNGYQYGTIQIAEENNAKKVSIQVLNGTLQLRSFTLEGFGNIDFKKSRSFEPGDTVTFTIEKR